MEQAAHLASLLTQSPCATVPLVTRWCTDTVQGLGLWHLRMWARGLGRWRAAPLIHMVANQLGRRDKEEREKRGVEGGQEGVEGGQEGGGRGRTGRGWREVRRGVEGQEWREGRKGKVEGG